MTKVHYKFRMFLSFWISCVLFVATLNLHFILPEYWRLPSGLSLAGFVALLSGIWLAATLLMIATVWSLRRKGRPAAEALMIGRLYRLVSILVIILAVAYGFNKLGTFGTLFTLFGGMLLGWSLQAPVSGFAAWVLISIKRPFRPGDRIQCPNLGLTGDVQEIGPMYVVLDQVGGTVGSEEAVGRHILVPNAMLFSQVVINYTVRQEAAYMLDEVVVRITYDSKMEEAERILLDAAQKVTGPIITATGVQPYIRSDFWEYGLLLRLRYQTRVKDRPQIAYEINKQIMQAVKNTPSVDLAIPFVYSYRAAMDRREENSHHKSQVENIQQIPVAEIHPAEAELHADEVDQLMIGIRESGLLQPIVLTVAPDGRGYHILAGHLRFEACRKLGWKSIPAIIHSPKAG
ncbi:MAG: mechanosensitive ion channel [Lentisphaerae bacterium]|nr:mechanosensitive ion channel [Lentisphaerota bacterium]